MDQFLNAASAPLQEEAQPASVFERAIAFIIDWLLIVTLCVWPYFILMRFGNWYPSAAQLSVLGFLPAVLFVSYSAVFASGGRRTLGKYLLGLKVVKRGTAEPLGFLKAALRGVGYLLSMGTFFLGFAFAVLNSRRLALADLMAGSEVISTREKSAAESVVISALGTLLIGLCFFYVYAIFFIMPGAVATRRIDLANKQLERIAFLENLHKETFGYYTPDLNRLALISGDPVHFQRDLQLHFRRRGFRIGVAADGYTIKALAKDKDSSEVEFTAEFAK
ncbi:MAG: RDD family protein [Elusimicrobiota bacterium]|jgi:uncharacterized RDD family membrane protein YckC|nr:RDD family protein [Elusimicrobiota bacterium]